jgi:hypothetical protein
MTIGPFKGYATPALSRLGYHVTGGESVNDLARGAGRPNMSRKYR